jgi:hypothetical protein
MTPFLPVKQKLSRFVANDKITPPNPSEMQKSKKRFIKPSYLLAKLRSKSKSKEQTETKVLVTADELVALFAYQTELIIKLRDLHEVLSIKDLNLHEAKIHLKAANKTIEELQAEHQSHAQQLASLIAASNNYEALKVKDEGTQLDLFEQTLDELETTGRLFEETKKDLAEKKQQVHELELKNGDLSLDNADLKAKMDELTKIAGNAGEMKDTIAQYTRQLAETQVSDTLPVAGLSENGLLIIPGLAHDCAPREFGLEDRAQRIVDAECGPCDRKF